MQADRHFCIAPPEYCRHVAERTEPVHCFIRLVGLGHDIQVADGFLAAAVAAGHFHLANALARPQMFEQALGDRVGLGPIEPLHFGRSGQAHPGQNRLLGLGAKTLEGPNLMGFAGSPQLIERGDLQFAIKRGGLLGA